MNSQHYPASLLAPHIHTIVPRLCQSSSVHFAFAAVFMVCVLHVTACWGAVLCVLCFPKMTFKPQTNCTNYAAHTHTHALTHTHLTRRIHWNNTAAPLEHTRSMSTPPPANTFVLNRPQCSSCFLPCASLFTTTVTSCGLHRGVSSV